MAVASLSLVVTCAATFTLLYLRSMKSVAVIGVAREVPEGQSVEAVDLKQVNVSLSSGLDTIPVSQASAVLGRRASVTLVAGTVLAPSELGATDELRAGEAIVGVDLKPGMLPASGVAPGQTVQVLLTGPSGSPVTGESPTSGDSGSASQESEGSSASLSADVITNALVVGVDDEPDDSGSGDVVVSVEVPEDDAPLVADASAASQAALVEVGG